MAEKLAEVYEQYDMEILSSRKGRGATILSTTEGLRILEPFRGNMTRLEQEYVLKQLFLEEGYELIDVIYPNKGGSLFTCDRYRQPFVLKKHFEGNECDMHNSSDVLRAVRALADFHIYGQNVAASFKDAWKRNRKEKEEKQIAEAKKALENGEEMEKLAFLYGLSAEMLEQVIAEAEGKEETDESGKNGLERIEANDKEAVSKIDSTENIDFDITDTFHRHNKELRKIQKFISSVKRKGQFENLFLKVFSEYHKKGISCAAMLLDMSNETKDVDTKTVLQNHYGICHGSYNQHNIIIGSDYEAIVHFERFSKGNQLNDLYQFARKTMEKNHFDFELLHKMFEVYGERISLSKEDCHYMYILFSYPEKFWKIANSYYNANKAFLSPKYLEKLETVILQEEEKAEMLEKFEAGNYFGK